MHTATWLIVLTMIVVGAIPVLLIWVTTMPHPKLLLAAQQPPTNSHDSAPFKALDIISSN